jgi:hypothetical protein
MKKRRFEARRAHSDVFELWQHPQRWPQQSSERKEASDEAALGEVADCVEGCDVACDANCEETCGERVDASFEPLSDALWWQGISGSAAETRAAASGRRMQHCIFSGGREIASASGPMTGTSITSSANLAVQRYIFAKCYVFTKR